MGLAMSTAIKGRSGWSTREKCGCEVVRLVRLFIDTHIMTGLWMAARRIATASQQHWPSMINQIIKYDPRCPTLLQSMHTCRTAMAHLTSSHVCTTAPTIQLALRAYSTHAIPSGYTPLVLYKARWIKPLRMLVRAKVFQLVAVAAVAVPMTTVFTNGTVTTLDVCIAAALVGGCAVAGTVRVFLSPSMCFICGSSMQRCCTAAPPMSTCSILYGIR